MSISEFSPYKVLKKKSGEQETEKHVEFVKCDVKSDFDSKANLSPQLQLIFYQLIIRSLTLHQLTMCSLFSYFSVM